MASIGSIPASYNSINVYNSAYSPSTVHCRNTALVRFFERYLFQRAMAPIKISIPDDWEENYFQYLLYYWGYIAIINTDKYGVICQGCGLGGYNVFYQPKWVVISNPLLRGTIRADIGVDAALIKLQPDYGGIYDIVSYYADLMAIVSEAAGFSAINSKLAYVFATNNKSGAETMKKMYDNISAGNVAQFIDKTLFNEDGSPNWIMFNQKVKDTYIVTECLQDLKQIEQMFDEQIGIPSVVNKKERMIEAEANSNNFSTMSNVILWLESIRKGCKKANEMFGLNLSADWREGWSPDGSAVYNGNVQLR